MSWECKIILLAGSALLYLVSVLLYQAKPVTRHDFIAGHSNCLVAATEIAEYAPETANSSDTP